ncbi:CR2 protein, partial [Rhadina sibilatrix]|nr:CR2 protein [Rhadina sibilatrix]
FFSSPSPAARCLLPSVRHGRVSPGRYFYGISDTVTFTCKPGYALRGARSSTCGPGSRWDPPPPECERGECPGRGSSAG